MGLVKSTMDMADRVIHGNRADYVRTYETKTPYKTPKPVRIPNIKMDAMKGPKAAPWKSNDGKTYQID